MKVLQYDNALKALDLPTIDWKQYFRGTSLTKDILWTIKVEEYTSRESQSEPEAKSQRFHLFRIGNRAQKVKKIEPLIGTDALSAQKYGEKALKQLDMKKQMLIYYPYYTVVKSGILDVNHLRVVLEGTKGDISNMVKHNRIDVTMIFDSDNVDIIGEEKFFTQEEVLKLIDYGRNIKQAAARDLAEGKNFQFYFSYVYKTSAVLKPVGDLTLIFYKFKIF